MTPEQKKALLKLLTAALPVIGQFLSSEEIEALETLKEELERDTV